MDYRLLLVDGHGAATAPRLRIRTLREFPGQVGVSVHFRPVRNDQLFESARVAGELAYRVLFGEGVVRNQLWVEYELPEEPPSVVGRSSDLLFALALTTAAWKRQRSDVTQLAATGSLDNEGAVEGIDSVPQKLEAALRALDPAAPGVIFYPTANSSEVARWQATATIPPTLTLHPVAHFDDALTVLGLPLERVYLGNPFRGLSAFGYEHRTVFFGREHDVREVVALLLRRAQVGTPGLLIEGVSGSGKSSFLRAGLLPALLGGRIATGDLHQQLARRPFSPEARHALWRPGTLTSPATEADLVASIRAVWTRVPECQTSLWPASLQTLDELAACLKKHWPAMLRFLWVIDPLEELLRLSASAEVLEGFGRFLRTLQSDGAWTLAATRADAVAGLKQIDALRETFGVNDGQYYLPALAGLALDDVISLPARAASLTFGLDADGKPLDQILREDIYGQANGLPLLQFTLDGLYQRRVGRELTVAAYQEMGGLSGSVPHTAAAAIVAAAGDDTTLSSRLFRSLVSVDEQGRPARRYAPLAESEADPLLQKVLRSLVEARLCVTDHRDGEPVIALAHDTLLQTLPALTEWLQRESSLVQARELALRDVRLWQQHSESEAWLASADKLALYRNLEAAGLILTVPLRRYLERSRQREQQTLRIKRFAVAAIGVLAVAASVAGWIATRRQHEAEHQTAEARRLQQKLAIQVADDRLKQGDLSLARGIVLDVLAQRDRSKPVDPIAANVFQDLRSRDTLLAVLPVHERESRYLRYSPDGRTLAIVPLKGPIQVWDAEFGVQRFTLEGPADNGGPAEFSPDGRTILSGGSEIYRWDAHTGKMIDHQKMPGGQPARAQYVPDGQRILISSEAEDILDARTLKPLGHVGKSGEKRRIIHVARDGKRALCLLKDNEAGVLDLATGRILSRFQGHTDDVIALQFSPDGKSVVTGSADTTVRLWDAATGRLLHTFENRVGQVWGVAFSPDGQQVLAAATDHSIRIWDIQSGTQVGSLMGHGGIAVEVEFSPKGDRVATLAYDGTARLWKWGQDPPAATLRGDVTANNDPSFSPDGSLVVAPTSDKGAAIWRVGDGKLLHGLRARKGTIIWAGYTKDGSHILTASDDNKLQWWDSTVGSLVREMEAGGEETASVGLSPDGSRASVGHLGTWTLHDLATGSQLKTVPGHKEYVTAVEFSPDGQRLLTTSLDHTVAIWDVASGTQQLVMQQPAHVNGGAYSHDGTRVLAGSEDHIVRIWDARSGALQLSLVGHPTRAYTGEFSPDDRWIATAGQDRTARVWDARSGEQLAIYRGFPERVSAVHWSPDAQVLVLTTFAGTVHFVRRGELAPLAEQITWAELANPDPLTAEDRQNLGLESTGPSKRLTSGASSCEAEAGAPYDPTQHVAGHERVDINPALAIAACDRDRELPVLASGRWEYLKGRALWASGKTKEAQVLFDEAWKAGHAAAGVDAALLRIAQDPSEAARTAARGQLTAAWDKGVARAATELARLEGQTTAGEPWLQKAQSAGDPSAFALAGEWEDRQLLSTPAGADRLPHLLSALRAYQQAARLGESAGWPEQTVRDWRFRRASLVRLLAKQQRMHEAGQTTAAAPR